jgi:hypothetical protein
MVWQCTLDQRSSNPERSMDRFDPLDEPPSRANCAGCGSEQAISSGSLCRTCLEDAYADEMYDLAQEERHEQRG